MPHVVEHSQKQHEIERADPCRRELERIDVEVFDTRAERAAGQFEAGLRTPSSTSPAERVGGQDAARPSTFGLEREKSVPRADVEHGEAGQVIGHLQLAQPRGGRIDSRRHHAVAQIDRVPPCRGGDLAPKRVER